MLVVVVLLVQLEEPVPVSVVAPVFVMVGLHVGMFQLVVLVPLTVLRFAGICLGGACGTCFVSAGWPALMISAGLVDGAALLGGGGPMALD